MTPAVVGKTVAGNKTEEVSVSDEQELAQTS